MAESNLKVPTPEEARENGRKGGIASGKARQKKKTIAGIMKAFLDEKITNEDHLQIIQGSGLPIEGMPTYKDFVVASVMAAALKKGNIDDLSKIMNLIGEMPIEPGAGEEPNGD